MSAALYDRIWQTPAVQDLLRRMERGGVLPSCNVSAGAHPFLAAQLFKSLRRPVVVVTDGLKSQETFHQDVETWLQFDPSSSPQSKASEESRGKQSAVSLSRFYPAWESFPHEGKLPHLDVISERLATLIGISRQTSAPGASVPLIVTTVAALMQRTFSPEALQKRTRVLRTGDSLAPEELMEWLESQGYEIEAQATQKGEAALRGGIIDVYPLANPWPIRFEFFGNELDSIRQYDPLTQVSTQPVASAVLPPGGELGFLRKMAAQPEVASDHSLGLLLDHLPATTLFLVAGSEEVEEQARNYAEQVPPGDPFFVSWPDLMSEIGKRGMSLLELSGFTDDLASQNLPESGRIDLNAGKEAAIAGSAGKLQTTGSSLRELGGEADIPARRLTGPQDDTLVSGQDSGTALHDSCRDLGFTGLEAFRPRTARFQEPQVLEAQRRELFVQLHRWLRQGFSVQVFCNNPGERQRFSEIWQEYGLSGPAALANRRAADSGSDPQAPPAWPEDLLLHIGSLSQGFLHEAARLVVITDSEIFGRYRVPRPRRLKSPQAATMRSALDIDFTDFEEGDHVVHLQYGIGRFVGLKILPPTGSHRRSALPQAKPDEGQECLVIEYAAKSPDDPPPRLYVPVTEAHLVSKYVGVGKARPQLHVLGGTRWTKAKEHAERAVRDLAGELLDIQAARSSQSGFAMAPDTPWQREFEGSFLFEETPDQLKAIQETKADMEQPRPMDRLICGDVGFGKTEVAIRAAFKAVMNGRQVAILTPTTVLAQQHFNTFRERMADYPARIELLSRFRTRREQNRVLEDLASGAVDIVIGTHRLVQSDVVFKDLGLAIIDEEQRFGVTHKEKFKQMRRLVDVLTLSATPIPRTLYLALTGARDMSTIETPPHDRLPVETIVTAYDERVIRDAIQREINRQGQVFFLHNRVGTIQTVAERLKALVPKARLVVGHGQMDSDELEEVMSTFINGQADVLLSTTIIESGLDIPNANTIIIDRADRFGLSDLYQLRGRVGRYKHQAYAYLLLPRHAGLLADARKRLSAIKQFSSLGSGFKIAMRDLEIRGAGNILGPEQSGHITAVGFELYCQLLKQSISALKGEKAAPRIEVQTRLDFLAMRADEMAASPLAPASSPKRTSSNAYVPRDVAVWNEEAVGEDVEEQPVERAAAFLPMSYVSESRQRIEIYRKLAQVTDLPSLTRLRTEIKDRFGPFPEGVELLLQVAQLKILASAKGITQIETRGDKLMLTRNANLVALGGKFPRLSKRQAKSRLNEIKKLILAL